MTMLYEAGVVAVIVTYQPELEILQQLLDALATQVESVVIVDNASHVDLELWNNQRLKSAVKVLLLGENRGIAAAHNLGIQWALNRGAEFVLLMDQDSIPAPDMVQKLTFAMLTPCKNLHFMPIAAGPVTFDTRTAKKSFFVSEDKGIPFRWRSSAIYKSNNSYREVSFLISSGSLINLKALQCVGGMRSNYFIDHVDTEWCFRARAKGYSLLGVPDAEMQHTLGDKVRNFWFFGWRQVAYHSPLRDYYMFRNTLLMLRDLKMPIIWRLYLLWRLIQFSGYFLFFTSLRIQRFNCMILGIAHGLRGISGKFDLSTGRNSQIPKSNLDP